MDINESGFDVAAWTASRRCRNAVEQYTDEETQEALKRASRVYLALAWGCSPPPRRAERNGCGHQRIIRNSDPIT